MTPKTAFSGRLFAFALLLLLPAAAALLVLAGLGLTSWPGALIAGAALFGLYWLIASRLGADIARLVGYAVKLQDERDAAEPAGLLPLPWPQLFMAMRGIRTAVDRDGLLAFEKAETLGAIIDNLPDPLLVLDRRRKVLRLNRGARALLGEGGLGRDLAQTLRHPDVLQAVDEALAGDGQAGQVDFQLAGKVMRQLRGHVVPFQREAHDGSRLLVALRDLTRERKIERMRADFVANASHELRTPLAAISGFIDTLRGPARDDRAAQERFLAMMDEQAERMARLIEDLLSLSRIEIDEHTVPKGEANLRGICEAVVRTLGDKAAKRRMNIVLEGGEALGPIPGDRDQLQQVVQNLVDNAIKYGAEGTEVTVRIAREGDRDAVLSVTDRGEGIPAHHLPRLTERFYRVDSARSRAMGGTGLGLAIVKHIVTRHHARLDIRSREGEGTTFTVTLPLQRGGNGARAGR